MVITESVKDPTDVIPGDRVCFADYKKVLPGINSRGCTHDGHFFTWRWSGECSYRKFGPISYRDRYSCPKGYTQDHTVRALPCPQPDSRHGELRRETDSWGHGTFEDCRASYFSWVNNCTENLELPSDEITPALKLPTGSCVRCKVVKETTLVLPTEDCIQGPPKELGAK
jgi:hypothetical protein